MVNAEIGQYVSADEINIPAPSFPEGLEEAGHDPPRVSSCDPDERADMFGKLLSFCHFQQARPGYFREDVDQYSFCPLVDGLDDVGHRPYRSHSSELLGGVAGGLSVRRRGSLAGRPGPVGIVRSAGPACHPVRLTDPSFRSRFSTGLAGPEEAGAGMEWRL